MSELVPEGWEVCNFGKYAKVRNGFAFKSSDFKEKGNGSFPIIRMSNLKKGVLDLSDAVYVDDSVVSDLEPFALKPNDFVFGMSGSITNYGVVKKSNGICYQNQRVGRLQSLGSNQTYLSYLFTSDLITRKIELMAAGAAQVNISSTQIEELEVPFPPLPEQKKIASILTSVDEVIEKTQSQIDKLQDLKKGTMNELLTKGIGHTEFKDSELGRIPKSWEVKSLPQCLDRIVDCEHKTAPEVDHSEFHVVSTNAVKDGEMLDDQLFNTSEESYRVWTAREIPVAGDVMFTREAPAGESCCVPDHKKVCLGQRMVLMRPITNFLSGEFLNFYINSDVGKKSIYRLSLGTTVSRINMEDIKKLSIPLPDCSEQREINEVILSIEDKIRKKKKSRDVFQNLKKSLMQDLLTGKVRV